MEDNKRQLDVFQSESIRDIVDFVNLRNLKKESILEIFQDERTNEFVLLYYI